MLNRKFRSKLDLVISHLWIRYRQSLRHTIAKFLFGLLDLLWLPEHHCVLCKILLLFYLIVRMYGHTKILLRAFAALRFLTQNLRECYDTKPHTKI